MASESWGEIDARTSKQNDNFPRMTDFVDVYDKKNYINQYKGIRLFGPISSTCFHSVKVKRRPPREGEAVDSNRSQEYFYMQPCLNHDFKTGEHIDGKCPYCEAGIPKSYKFYQNGIIREIEENEPANKGERTPEENTKKEVAGFAGFYKSDKNSRAWTPVRVVEIPKGMVSSLKTIEDTNFYKDPETGERKTATISDLKNGVDVLFVYFPDKPAMEMYKAVRDSDSGKTPITKEIRQNYLIWDVFQLPQPEQEKVIANFKRDAERILNAKNPEFIASFIAQNTPTKAATPASAKAPKPIKEVSLDDDDIDDISIDTSLAKAPVQIASVAADIPTTSSSSIDDDGLDDFEDL